MNCLAILNNEVTIKMKITVKFLWVLAGWLISMQSFAQLPTIKTTVDKQNILIGERIIFTVQANFSDNYFVTWPSIPDSVAHFEVIARHKIDTVEDNGSLTCTQQVIITSFDSGKNMIPSFAMNFNAPQNKSDINVFTDSIPINVAYSPLDSVKTFHDIKPVIEVSDNWPLWMWIAAALSLLVLIGIIIFTINYFRKNKTEKKIFQAKLSPFDEAIKSLNDLHQQELLQMGQAKQFHIKLSDIFKRYISRKLNRNMFNLTSTGMLMAMNETLLSREDTSLLASSLKMADAVKFAKYIPPAYESEQAFSNTKNVIEKIDKLQSVNETKN